MVQRLDEKSGPDHLELITEAHRPSEDTASGALFVVCRFAPIVVAVILGAFGCATGPAFLITLPLNLLDFCVTKSHFGLGLVGLKWYFDRTESPIFPFLVFYSRPFPFVASTGNSNLFWIGLLASAVADIVLALFFVVAGRIAFVVISVIMLFLALLNISGFVRCHNIAKSTAEKAARSLLLDQNVSFQAAKEANVSDQASEEESVKEGTTALPRQAGEEGSDEIE
jgi:hypothetical protein